jgi:hypothetical protein
VTCRVLGFSKQAFYAWCKQPVSDRDWADAHLINAAYDIHRDDPAFGYRFIADELCDSSRPRTLTTSCMVSGGRSLPGQGEPLSGRPRGSAEPRTVGITRRRCRLWLVSAGLLLGFQGA